METDGTSKTLRMSQTMDSVQCNANMSQLLSQGFKAVGLKVWSMRLFLSSNCTLARKNTVLDKHNQDLFTYNNNFLGGGSTELVKLCLKGPWYQEV
jgi:hypothetical protein